MKVLLIAYFLVTLISPAKAVTTKMFKVLDTCARYRLREIDVTEAIDKLKLQPQNSSEIDLDNKVGEYCSVFTPNQKIEY